MKYGSGTAHIIGAVLIVGSLLTNDRFEEWALFTIAVYHYVLALIFHIKGE